MGYERRRDSEASSTQRHLIHNKSDRREVMHTLQFTLDETHPVKGSCVRAWATTPASISKVFCSGCSLPVQEGRRSEGEGFFSFESLPPPFYSGSGRLNQKQSG